MGNIIRKSINIIVLPVMLLGVTACAVTGNNSIDNDGDSRHVSKVAWNNQTDADINRILDRSVSADKTRLVFIRQNDGHPEQTSANIAVNNRFQVSLHAGNYTVVESCVGINQLSAHATGFKDNNLLANKKDYELAGGQTYFFHVNMTETGQSTLQRITADSALQLLAKKRYQSHQISRVVPNCPLPIVAAPPTNPPTVIKTPTPALSERMTIDLEILFETDKAVVRPEYYSKATELVEFMRQYPNTVVTIEGHTDSRGKDNYNQDLSQRRVDAVKDVLITEFGIDSDRISAIGYGESQPRASNDTVDGRQLNRRVVAVVEERVRN
ncbi:OmpA family protein [Psychrobacter sp. Pi2-52]|uniref:OmpA family protein n=1 Tax=Psychrobacter sp. Pi2-52 TaxID=2774133 RepID=UPI001919B0E4|nr:OmpA family protein [Psychrobacter sp. Pi2-52]